MSKVKSLSEVGKICIISLENKRIIDFNVISSVANGLASFGYYADKISRVAFNRADEIVRALDDGNDNYDNVIVVLPARMKDTITDFFTAKLGGQFDGTGVLSAGDKHIFLTYSDGASRLKAEDIKDILDKKYGVRFDKAVIRCVGAPKKALDAALSAGKKAFSDGDVFFNVSDSYGDTRIEIAYSSKTPKMALDDCVRGIVSGLDGYVYALEDVTLAEQLVRLLKLRRMKVATAESFTGGGVGKRLVEISGVSEVYFEGLNTYSNESKHGRLGVEEETLARHGAVSAETAYQMAEGLIKTGNCTVAISTTGIAGPKSDNTQKPVGLAYIGVAVGENISVYKFNFKGDRRNITETAINEALFLTYKSLK